MVVRWPGAEKNEELELDPDIIGASRVGGTERSSSDLVGDRGQWRSDGVGGLNEREVVAPCGWRSRDE